MSRIVSTMLQALKQHANHTVTENGAAAYRSSGLATLDLFATIGALRHADPKELEQRFDRAWAEDRDLAMKLLFYARDIRNGLGERHVFRTILSQMAWKAPESVIKNIPYIPEFGRFDDLFVLLSTPCEKAVLDYIKEQLEQDLKALKNDSPVSLLAKWMPSVNASNPETVAMAKRIAGMLGMSQAKYRKTLSALRAQINILENDLREKNYTFDYEKQPSNALFKYRKAFARNDKLRYTRYLEMVRSGKAKMHTGTLMPYEIIRRARSCYSNKTERASLDTAWNALKVTADDRNALAVIDGSGSMYFSGCNPLPADVALSLGILFAERNTGAFQDHFITFSSTPQLVKIQGQDIADKVRFCRTYQEVANTNLQKVFELILHAAAENHLPQKELPETLYIISDMEFDRCTEDASLSNFEYARKLYAAYGYQLPNVVFWNVNSRTQQQPVKRNEQGVALVSGSSPNVFSMVMDHQVSPEAYMMKILGQKRYEKILA